MTHPTDRSTVFTITEAIRRAARSPLFRKYVALFLAVVSAVLLFNALFMVWFSYQETRAGLIKLQREQAESAASKIGQFVREIENQLGWTTQLPWSTAAIEQRRFDGLRLLRQVPAITELVQLDGKGLEQLRVSRLSMDAVGTLTDNSKELKFTSALANKIFYSPIYFRRESEPYMTLSMAGARRDAGVSVAEVNLKFIWDVVSQIKVGQTGQAFVVDAEGRLLAHPDISLVLRKTDLSKFEQVISARQRPNLPDQERIQVGRDVRGERVLTAHAAITPTGWLVFVELPEYEANAPLRAALARSALLLLGGLSLAGLAGLFLARRMLVPIEAMRAGAMRIGSGDLDHRITIKTNDELQELADGFNDMAGRLSESYTDLEGKIEIRTRELAQSIADLRTLGEVSQSVNSSLNMDDVLSTIVAKAVQLSRTDAGSIYVLDHPGNTFTLRANFGMTERLIAEIGRQQSGMGLTMIGRAARSRQVVQVADLLTEPDNPVQALLLTSGFKAVLAVPLIGVDSVVGCLIVRRKQTGEFAPQVVDLMQTFAAQSTLALQNARLFREIQEKGRQLEIASEHKSQFLANMSHELRTPLNAILGYTELIIDGVYGAVPEKSRQVLDRVQVNGKHLLSLINDVLDLTKIEAGQLSLSLADYQVGSLIDGVISATGSLAQTKGLELRASVEPGLPTAFGDERRLKQVMLNLVGNALKFTDKGHVEVAALKDGDTLRLRVSDTGPGIAARDQAKVFEEFQQVDTSSTKEKGGSGLGLAITKRIVEMHGGTVGLTSEVGVGSVFTVTLPIRVAAKKVPHD